MGLQNAQGLLLQETQWKKMQEQLNLLQIQIDEATYFIV